MQHEENFKEYIVAFEKQLDFVVIDDISSTSYCKRYLAYLLQHKKYYLAIYADVLHKLVQHSSKSKTGIVLIDYGSGNGLLGIFAKFCGFKKVFLTDIDAKFIQASEKLAAQLNIKMDGYLTGDIHTVQGYFKNETPDAIAGTDVIEHIYNPENFFTGLQQINQSIVSVLTTASNPNNYYRVSKLKRFQIKDELKGGNPGDHILFGESPLEPFLKIREEIIRKFRQNLAEVEIFDLAKNTRGMNKQDIEAAVEHYNKTGEFPNPPAHKTNTCNPFNGSWTERILTLKEYTLLYTAAGFKPIFYNGFYNVYEGGIKSYGKKILNSGIAVFGDKISPYIVIVGYRS
ncbi:MAG: class I SAM-dependent methyltransferase [Ferruginibacter sp.]